MVFSFPLVDLHSQGDSSVINILFIHIRSCKNSQHKLFNWKVISYFCLSLRVYSCMLHLHNLRNQLTFYVENKLMIYVCAAMRRQIEVAAYFTSKQLLLFVYKLQDSLLPSSTGILTAVQRQTAVTAYFTAVCLWAAGISSAIEYWHTDRRAKTNSSNCLLYCCLPLSCRILFCHRVLACWPPCKDKQQ